MQRNETVHNSILMYYMKIATVNVTKMSTVLKVTMFIVNCRDIYNLKCQCGSYTCSSTIMTVEL